MSLSTHVLDATTGKPAAGLTVSLWRQKGDDGTWVELHDGRTDGDGRIQGWPLDEGAHRLVFATGLWWARHGVPAFHPEVVVTFIVTDPEVHYHVPLLASPFAYTTYKGS